MNWKLRSFLTFNLLITSLFSFAEDFDQPSDAVEHHLTFLQEDHFKPDESARALRFPANTPEKKKRQLAIKLKQIYDLNGWFIYIESIPSADSLKGKPYFVIAGDDRFKVTQWEGTWKYDVSTVAKIESIHNSLFPPGTDLLLSILPRQSHQKIFGLFTWQWIGLLIMLGLAVLLKLLVTQVLKVFLNRFLIRHLITTGSETQTERLAQSSSWWAALIVLRILLPVLMLPVQANKVLLVGLGIAITLMGILFFYRLIEFLGTYFNHRAHLTKTKMDDQLVPLLVIVAKIITISIGVILMLSKLNVDVRGLIAGLSIGGLALALAAQDTLKNFLGSITIFLDKPFQIGDWISGGDIDGTVEEVGFRSTRVRTFRDSVMYVPNGKLADMVTDNNGMRTYRRYSTHIGVTYDTSPDALRAFVKGIEELVVKHPEISNHNYKVRLNSFGDFSLQILVYVFFNAPDWDEELKIREELMLSIIELAEELGVRFAFPTQTLHVEEVPGQESLTPPRLSKEELEQRRTAFIEDRPNPE
jgi:MscS family membrane protein